MNKIPSLFEIISSPLTLRESEIVNEINRRIKKFDKYERIDGYRCALCPPDANWHPASEMYPDNEYGDLCKRVWMSGGRTGVNRERKKISS